MKVYVLIPRAIYDHGAIGIYATREQAEAVARELWPQSDGHHSLVIVEYELGKTYNWDILKWPYSINHSDPGEPRILYEGDTGT